MDVRHPTRDVVLDRIKTKGEPPSLKSNERDALTSSVPDSSDTLTLGLYRGIKLGANQNDRPVKVLDETLDELIANDDWPVLLAVELPYGTDDTRYANEWGWIPGMGHSVVALGKTPDGNGLLIGDPSVGLESWSVDDL